MLFINLYPFYFFVLKNQNRIYKLILRFLFYLIRFLDLEESFLNLLLINTLKYKTQIKNQILYKHPYIKIIIYTIVSLLNT